MDDLFTSPSLPPKWTESKVIKLSDAIFQLGVFKSDFAGSLTELEEALQNRSQVIVFGQFGYPYDPGKTAAFEECDALTVLAIATRLCGYGIRWLRDPWPSYYVFQIGAGRDVSLSYIDLPLAPNSIDRMSSQSLAQDAKRVWRRKGGMARRNARPGPDEPIGASAVQGASLQTSSPESL